MELVEVWRQVIANKTSSWVLFEHGTVVIFTESQGDLSAAATEILREYGPVYAGTPAGDFDSITLPDDLGWAVTGHHPDVLTYVAPDEVTEPANGLVIGLTGRSKRDQDGHELAVIHIEDKRPQPAG